MKKVTHLFAALSFTLFFQFGNSQPKLNAKLGVNSATIRDNFSYSNDSKIPQIGFQTGLGAVLPFGNNWFFSPMLWCTQGGEANKEEQFKWGVRNNYAQLSTPIGFNYNISPKHVLQLEAGPILNFWGKSVEYNDFSGAKEKNKLDLSNNEMVNRTFLSGVAELSFTWKLKPFDLSFGLRGELGLTPLQKFEDFNGGTIKLHTQSIAFVVGISNPFNDPLGKNSVLSGAKIKIDPSDLMVEDLYTETRDSYRKARSLVDSAQYKNTPGVQPEDLAQQALEEIEHTRKLLNKGIIAWDNREKGGIGPSTADTFTQFLNDLETRARSIIDSEESDANEEEGDESTDNVEDSTGDESTEEDEDQVYDGDPIIYGEEIDPSWITVEGAMQPSQGVWQDDDYFDDKPTKQISEIDPATWRAELDMVAKRWTGVFGVREFNHVLIKMSGTSTYSVSVPVKFRLKLLQGGNEKIIWTQPESEFSIPIDGGPGPEQSWQAYLMQEIGDPPVPKTFKMEPGEYTLELELIRENGKETGLKIKTIGNVVETSFPKVHIVPVILSNNWTRASALALYSDAKRLSLDSESLLPKVFPLPENSVTVIPHPIQNLASQKLGSLDRLISVMPLTSTQENVRRDRMVASMIQKFATSSQLSDDGKVIVILDDDDFALTDRRYETIAGYAPHEKVLVLKKGMYATSVAHELIHSIPFSWADNGMTAECGKNYHNSYDNDYGNGVSVRSYGAFYREGKPAIMGEANSFSYITQCSYWHLLKHLQGAVDPPMYLVRGFLGQRDGQYYGTLSPTFEFESITGLPTGAIAPDGWGIVLRNAAGQELASYPFNTVWKYPDTEEERSIIAFNHRIDRIPGTTTIELVGPGGIKDVQTVSANAPTLEITSPIDGSIATRVKGQIKVKWKGDDPDGDKLSYLVFYSPDGGENWQPMTDEQRKSNYDLEVTVRPTDPRVRIIATDGVRSASAEVGFTIAQ